jgi:UDP-2-acetamido-3-amino-2,3-dideoxy-glucuronate N-acetyltransferase
MNVTMAKVFIHETAIVEDPSNLGEGVKVWHFCHVAKGCLIGAETSLGQNVYIAPGAIVGCRVKVQNNVSIYDGVEIEDDVFIGPSAVFTNVRTPRAHVARKSDYEKTIVRKGATIGANATIVCGNTIGEYALVGAGTVITKHVPSHAMVAGNPALRIGWACRCGARLSDDMTCSECDSVYCLDNNEVCFQLKLTSND